ncbi:hypothetical protein GIB67_022915 [Kingdonia uniflora]|uniref:DUF8039 domain-containing protein n=1 Tax=Kingdonia uniflora TaxID=39325 RepID=A0A7J7P246_9MAGN|nr:hypothetical protein GIB67_022915 [Kingdonia uniflora]
MKDDGGQIVAAGSSDDMFPEGLRVLVIDDDPNCLLIAQVGLKKFGYNVTTTRDPYATLEFFDNKNTIMKGVKHGECDYLVKPVVLKELKNIWLHVIRKNRFNSNDLNVAKSEANQIEKSKKGQKRYSTEREDESEDNSEEHYTSKKNKGLLVSAATQQVSRGRQKVISPGHSLPSQQTASSSQREHEKHQHIDKECRLVGCPWRIVAHGVIVGADPSDMYHLVALGDDSYKVVIHEIVDGNALLFWPNSNIKRLLDVGIESFVAWPKSMITF